MSTTFFIDYSFFHRAGTRPSDRPPASWRHAGLTLEALGERVRLRPQSISRYECGRLAPRWGRLVKFVEVLGVGLVDVADG